MYKKFLYTPYKRYYYVLSLSFIRGFYFKRIENKSYKLNILMKKAKDSLINNR